MKMKNMFSGKVSGSVAFADSAEIDCLSLRKFTEKIEKQGYIFKNILIYKNSKQVARCFRKPFSPDFPNINYAFCNTLVALAIGFAVKEGLIHTDTSIGEFFEEEMSFREIENVGNITVSQLLTMTSGIGNGVIIKKNISDRFKNFASSKRKETSFIYNGDNFSVLSRMLTKATGLTVSEYLTPRLFDPLEIEKPLWETDCEGYENGGYGLFLPVEDTAKIIQCILNRGEWNGLRIIPESWVNEMTGVKVSGVNESRFNSLSYGYGILIDERKNCLIPENIFGQYILIFPEHNAFVIINSAEIPKIDILPAIYKFFPGIFDPGDKSEKEGEDINRFLNSFSYPILKSGPRNLASEAGINGNLYRLIRRKYFSMQNITEIFSLRKKPGYFDEITFDFHENSGEIIWDEALYGKNTLSVSLDSSPCFSEVYLSEGSVHYASFGKWTADGKFIVQVISMEFPEVRQFVFRFNKNRIHVKSHTSGSLFRLTSHNLKFSNYSRFTPVLLLFKFLSLLLSPRYTPSFTSGKCKSENGINKSNL